MDQRKVAVQAQTQTAPMMRAIAATGLAAVFGAAAIAVSLGQGAPAKSPAPTDGSSALLLVPQDQLEDALETVDVAQREAVKEDIKTCKRLPTQMRISKMPGASGPSSGMVQVRSGGYLSPTFKIGDYPITIMVPTPDTPASGRGTVEYIGSAENVRLELDPPLDVPSLKGSKRVDVIWENAKSCVAKG